MSNGDGSLALDGTRIVDLTGGIAGPYATLLLAGLGADVIKVEPPDGDPTRLLPPFAGGAPGTERGLAFLHLNRGSRSVVLDREREQDRQAFRELVATADALIVDGTPEAALEPWGATAGELRARHPGLVIASLVAFGDPGPWAGWSALELILSAASGLASCTGEADRSPLKVGGYVCQVAHGQTVAAATLAALLQARRGGGGSDIEVSGAEANADLLEMWACGAFQDRPMPRQGRHHNSNYPFEVYPCRDGLAGIHAGPGPWDGFLELVGSDELDAVPAGGPGGRMRLREQVDPIILDWLAGVGKFEVYHAGQARRLAFGYVATIEDLVRSPQLAARDFFRPIAHPEAAGGLYPGPPFRLSSGWRDARAPLLGEHTEQVLAEQRSLSDEPAPDVRASDGALPLSGVRVLDLTQIWAGPRATKVLGDYGADVIKIESPTRTDGTRGYGRFLADRDAGRVESEREFYRGTQFEQLHRGQRSVTLDLRSADGKRAFEELVAVSDVVIANFAYGVLARLGIDWPDLERVNPRVVLLSMTSFGDSGPERDYVAYGVTQEELSGIYGLTGYQDGEPLKSGSNIGDPMNGMQGVVAILAALLERERTGRGQYIELSQLESTINFIGEALVDHGVNGTVAAPAGNSHPLWAPHGVYPARGEDQWVAIAARSDAEWASLLDALDGAAPPENALRDDARFRRPEDRLANRGELDAAIGRLTAGHDRDELAARLQASGVPAAPVLNSVEVQHHPQYAATDYVQVRDYPGGGEYRYFGPLWRIDGQRPQVSGVAPLLGEHNHEVLEALTSLSAAEIEAATG